MSINTPSKDTEKLSLSSLHVGRFMQALKRTLTMEPFDLLNPGLQSILESKDKKDVVRFYREFLLPTIKNYLNEEQFKQMEQEIEELLETYEENLAAQQKRAEAQGQYKEIPNEFPLSIGEIIDNSNASFGEWKKGMQEILSSEAPEAELSDEQWKKIFDEVHLMDDVNPLFLYQNADVRKKIAKLSEILNSVMTKEERVAFAMKAMDRGYFGRNKKKGKRKGKLKRIVPLTLVLGASVRLGPGGGARTISHKWDILNIAEKNKGNNEAESDTLDFIDEFFDDISSPDNIKGFLESKVPNDLSISLADSVCTSDSYEQVLDVLEYIKKFYADRPFLDRQAHQWHIKEDGVEVEGILQKHRIRYKQLSTACYDILYYDKLLKKVRYGDLISSLDISNFKKLTLGLQRIILKEYFGSTVSTVEDIDKIVPSRYFAKLVELRENGLSPFTHVTLTEGDKNKRAARNYLYVTVGGKDSRYNLEDFNLNDYVVGGPTSIKIKDYFPDAEPGDVLGKDAISFRFNIDDEVGEGKDIDTRLFAINSIQLVEAPSPWETYLALSITAIVGLVVFSLFSKTSKKSK